MVGPAVQLGTLQAGAEQRWQDHQGGSQQVPGAGQQGAGGGCVAAGSRHKVYRSRARVGHAGTGALVC